MPGGFGPRFAVEAGFLILLAVGAGLADLRPALIVAIMAGAWLLVSLLEWAIWRGQAGAAAPRPAAAPAEPEPESQPEREWPAEESAPEPEPADYPLRVDAGSEPQEEVEAYTRVLGTDNEEPQGVPVTGEGDVPGERAE